LDADVGYAEQVCVETVPIDGGSALFALCLEVAYHAKPVVVSPHVECDQVPNADASTSGAVSQNARLAQNDSTTQMVLDDKYWIRFFRLVDDGTNIGHTHAKLPFELRFLRRFLLSDVVGRKTHVACLLYVRS
jgi:hypothetical protein